MSGSHPSFSPSSDLSTAVKLDPAKTLLSTNWFFKQVESANPVVPSFLPCRTLPTEIHLDLLSHKLIPDPFLKQNENDVQWIGEESWLYHTAFRSPDPASPAARTFLVFDGLDTFATVTLNGSVVLQSENMFIQHRVDVTSSLLLDSENVLEILFESASRRGKQIREKYPDFSWGCWNGDSSRLAVRKAQYHYGWDWGPILMTCGPWKAVYLESFVNRVAELQVVVNLDPGFRDAKLQVKAEVEGPGDKVMFTLTSPNGGIRVLEAEVRDGLAEGEFVVKESELWWPIGYGAQKLYTLTATAGEGATSRKRFGIRNARVVQRELAGQEGSTFFFEVNGVPIWLGGSNWIPADNFLTRMDEVGYRRWLNLVRDGNQIMVRVWGGGTYEADIFYDICDEYGILVWQDFAFGCGNYPAMIPEFQDNVQREAIMNVKRLRHHPSIVIYAGNNEDYMYMMAQAGRLGYNPADTNPQNWLTTQFPARYIYERMLPDIVAKYSPGTEYHPGSPYGTPAQPGGADNKRGDIHQWNVWHGAEEPYQNYKNLAGRFVSEFGMEAFPALSTVKQYLADSPAAEHQPFSSTVKFHNKAAGGEQRLAHYLEENLIPNVSSLEGYAYSTQLLQSEALTAAFVAWRRNWKGPGEEFTSGALVWQMNDCWPGTSWSIVDHFYNPKLSYYAIKRSLAQITVAIERISLDTQHRIQIWGSNLRTQQTASLMLEIRALDVTTGETLEEFMHGPIVLPPNRSTELFDIPLPGQSSTHRAGQIVIAVRFLHDQSTIARFVSWPEPLKNLVFGTPPVIEVKVERDRVRVRADKPVKGFELVADAEGVVWDDNGIDLVSGEEVVVGVVGLGDNRVKARWYGHEVAVAVHDT